MGHIYLKNIRLYAYHGCMDEEEKIGGDYIINVKIKTDLAKPSVTDNLNDTVDYVAVHSIVKAEMLKRSKLLESIASRISKRIIDEFAFVSEVTIKVAKQTPPVGGNVEEVSVKQKLKRKDYKNMR